MRLTPATAINDPHLLGLSLPGASWNRWRAVRKAVYGQQMVDTPTHSRPVVSCRNQADTAAAVRQKRKRCT